jgi:EAL domain-containing protein (putative c-di-GMP-specific phosphodiesterase class I)
MSAVAPAAFDHRRLRQGIAAGELFLQYQPKVRLSDRRTIGVEALARWRHPELGLILPDRFIPMAEESGLIEPLTEWVVATAVAQWKAWKRMGVDLNIAVNVSAHNLARIDFPDRVSELCEAEEAPLSALTFELTESATQSVVNLLDILTRLRLKGAHVSLDDFGTGYSSLAQLHRLPFSEMKIDRSFVSTADTKKDSQVIAKAVVDLGHNLGLGVVAEGVESARVLDMLGDFGCDLAQGYYIARPTAPDDIARFCNAESRIDLAPATAPGAGRQ